MVVVAALDEVCCAGRLVEATAAQWADVLVRAERLPGGSSPVDFGPRALQRLGERLLEVVAPEWVDELEERRLREVERAARRRTTLKVQGLGDGTALIKARVPESVALRLTPCSSRSPTRAVGRRGRGARR